MEEKIEPQPLMEPEAEPSVPSLWEKLKANKFKILGGVLGILVLAGAVFGAYKFGRKEILSEVAPSPSPVTTPSPSPTGEPKPPVSFQEKPTPTPISSPIPSPSVPTSSFAHVELVFSPKHTSEPISKFFVEIMRYGEVWPILSFEGAGNGYTFEELEQGEYVTEVYIESRLGRLCSKTTLEKPVLKEEHPYFFAVKAGDKLKKTIYIYPFPGMINLLTQDGYPISGVEITTTNHSGTEDYYSIQTDSLGRAVVYTLNPLPQYIKVKLPRGGDLIKEFSQGNCLWWQTINVPLAVTRGKVVANIENRTSSAQNTTVYLTKTANPVEIKPNSVMHVANFESFHRGVFSPVWFEGAQTLVSIKSSNIYLGPNESRTVDLGHPPLGDYRVLAKTSSYMVSNIESITLSSADETKTINLVIQYKQ